MLTPQELERQDEAVAELQRLTQLFADFRQHFCRDKPNMDQTRIEGEGSNAESLQTFWMENLILPESQTWVPKGHLMSIVEFSWLEAKGVSLHSCAREFATVLYDGAILASCVIY